MTKSFITNKPALNMTVVGFGQAGARIVDVFAKYQTAEGEQTYNCLALNSNTGDFNELKFIDPNNRISLDLGGLGKNPEKAEKILAKNEQVKAKMHEFISKKLRVKDDLVIFACGLGGGTGTSTIVKAIEDFQEIHNKPIIQQVLKKMIETVGEDFYKQHEVEINKKALKAAEEQFVKIGVIACLPLAQEGPDVLRQVNKFADKIWKLANDPTKGVSFVMFPDNEFFYNNFKNLPQTTKATFDNYRDYSNFEIANTIHEINTAAMQGGTSIVMDSQDLKRALTENQGCLILSKQEVSSDVVETAHDIKKLFEKAVMTSCMHAPIELVSEQSLFKVHHLGLLASIDSKKDYGNGSYMDAASEYVLNNVPIVGTIFNGYVQEKNESTVTAYVFYKADALPQRLARGLVEEYNEYVTSIKQVTFKSASIAEIKENEVDLFGGAALSNLGLEDLNSTETKKEQPADILAALDDFDFTF